MIRQLNKSHQNRKLLGWSFSTSLDRTEKIGTTPSLLHQRSSPLLSQRRLSSSIPIWRSWNRNKCWWKRSVFVVFAQTLSAKTMPIWHGMIFVLWNITVIIIVRWFVLYLWHMATICSSLFYFHSYKNFLVTLVWWHFMSNTSYNSIIETTWKIVAGVFKL